MLRYILPALALGITATSADATAVIYNFSGTVGSGIAGTGDTFSGSFSYDAAVAASQCGSYSSGSYCTYAAISNLTFASGSVSTTITVEPGGPIFQILNNYKSNPSASPYDQLDIDTDAYGSSSNGYYRIMIRLYDSTASALNDTSAPSPIMLNKFNLASVRVETEDGTLGGTITSLTSPSITETIPALPEPATWAMMIAGFGLVGGAMRRRRMTPALA